jgi:hypothetical protein
MKNATGKTLVVAAISAVWVGSAAAQRPPPSFAAVEGYMCNFVDGKDRKDLDKVVKKWNQWMDDSKSSPYSAWILTPVLHSTSMPYDVVWLGVWQNGNDMGRGMQAWMTGNDGLAEEFEDVISCDEHSNAASVNIRPPGDEWPTATGVVSFSNCSVAEGKTVPEAMDAHRAWAEHLGNIGSKSGMWAFFPGDGANVGDWDYKIATSYPDFVAYGAAWEAFTNGQGWAQAQKIGAGTVSCDSARLFHSTTVRNGGINPAPG